MHFWFFLYRNYSPVTYQKVPQIGEDIFLLSQILQNKFFDIWKYENLQKMM